MMINSIVSSFPLGNIRLVLSANLWMIDLENTHKVPWADPWKTPHVIVLMLDEFPCRKPYCLRFLKRELKNLLANPRIPQYSCV